MDAGLDRERQRLVKRMTTKPVDPEAPLPPSPFEVASDVAEDFLAAPTGHIRQVWDDSPDL